MAATSTSTDDIVSHLKDLYTAYRRAPSLDEKAPYFSPECRQICRRDPSYAARDRATILRYLQTAGDDFKDLIITSPSKKSYYSMRALVESEMNDFGTDEHVMPAGFGNVDELRMKARDEGWVGLRVDMWDVDEEAGRGLLVKVHYWWVKDADGEWRQILHDILYLGELDGTEGSQGEILC